jgi:hypothetical protein
VMECNLTGGEVLVEVRRSLESFFFVIKNWGKYVCGIVSPGDLESLSWCSPSLSQV